MIGTYRAIADSIGAARAQYRGIIVANIKRLKFDVNEDYAELSKVMAG